LSNGRDLVDEKARVTIADVNDGRDFIIDREAARIFGIIVGVQTWDNVNKPEVLMERGWEYLASQKMLGVTLELSAVDLQLLGVDVNAIRIGNRMRVISEPHGVNEMMTVVKIERDLDRADATSITLGARRATLIDSGNDKLSNMADEIHRSTEANYSTTGQVREVIEHTSATLSSQIDQTAAQILLGVAEQYVTRSNIGEYIEERAAELALTSDQLMLRFEELLAYAQNIDGEINQYQRELSTWIRFSIDGMTMGKADSPFNSTIDNERLAFLQNGRVVAYIAHNKMYITDAEVTNSLIIGKFAFIPRANGNLSFTWIGG